MIAATAIAEDRPLYTTNPGDYAGGRDSSASFPSYTRSPLPQDNNHGQRE
jgi:hypothetical protein